MPLVLATALLAVSVAGTLVRLAPGADPLTLAFGRCLVAGLALLPFGVGALRARPPSRRDLAWTALAGLFLALHFYAWFASLQRTSVLRSTVLVCTTPVWVGLIEAGVLRRPPPARYWPGIAVALVGVVGLALHAGDAAGASPSAHTGDLLALAGSWLGATYFVLGSVVRQRVDIGVYGPLVCLAAACVLGALGAAQGAPLVPTGAALGVVLAMAAGPQLLGHIGFNWAVRYVPARVIATVILLEPVGGALLAVLLLGEQPTWGDGAWGAVLLLGVGIAVG